MLLRVPGLGVKTIERLLAARRGRALRSDDLKRLRIPLAKVMPFVLLPDHRPGRAIDTVAPRPAPRQATLFEG